MSEGIAEYIANYGKAWSASVRAGAVRRWIRSHGWSGTRSLPDSSAEASGTEIDAFYGLSHLMFRCLASRYGEAKMLRFFKIAKTDGNTEYDASRTVFGKDWGAVDRGCVSFVRNA